MRNFTDDLADQNKHFKFLVRGVFQHMEPPISATFRENVEGYFHRWLVSERLDMNVDVNDEQTMHQYGLEFSEYLLTSRTDITVLPGPDKAYVDLREKKSTLADDSDDDGTQFGDYSLPGSLSQEEEELGAKTSEFTSNRAERAAGADLSSQIDSNLDTLLHSLRSSRSKPSEVDPRLSPVRRPEEPPVARPTPQPGRRDPESYCGQPVARIFFERLYYGEVTKYLPPVADDDEAFWQILFKDGDHEQLDEAELREAMELHAEKTSSPTRPDPLHSKSDRGKERSATTRRALFATKPDKKNTRSSRSSPVSKRFIVIDNALTCTEDKLEGQQRQAVRKDVEGLKNMMTEGLTRLGSQLSRVVEAVQVLSMAQDHTPLSQRRDQRGRQHGQLDSTLKGRRRPMNSVHALVHQDVHPQDSPEDTAERSLVEQELMDTRRERGESNGLFRKKDGAPPNVVRGTHDIFAGTTVETDTDINQLRYLHTPQHKVEVAYAMNSHDDLLAFTDQARELGPSLVTLLVQDWQNHDELTPGLVARTKQHYRTKAFVVDYQSYCESLVTLLVALDRKYRHLRCTKEAWKVVKRIVKQLEKTRQFAVGRMTTGLQDTNSSKVKADNILALYSATASFIASHVGPDHKLNLTYVPYWLEPTLTEAEEARQIAVMSSRMPALRQQQLPQAPKQKSVNFPTGLSIVKRAYAAGLSHFSTDEKTLSPPSTHSRANWGCGQCGSLLHYYTECPNPQKLTSRKEVATALTATGRKPENAAALAAAGTNADQFEEAVKAIYN